MEEIVPKLNKLEETEVGHFFENRRGQIGVVIRKEKYGILIQFDNYSAFYHKDCFTKEAIWYEKIIGSEHDHDLIRSLDNEYE